ncbi:MAG: hypothetical protein ACLUKN_03740 [Bacilli bacterium]
MIAHDKLRGGIVYHDGQSTTPHGYNFGRRQWTRPYVKLCNVESLIKDGAGKYAACAQTIK